jgi:hypothetical protein
MVDINYLQRFNRLQKSTIQVTSASLQRASLLVRLPVSRLPASINLGSGGPFADSPLYPDERTSSDRADWSVSCQPETHAPQQFNRYSTPSLARASSIGGTLSQGAQSFGWLLRIRLLPVSGGTIRRNRCGRGALRPTARASAPRPGRPSIGPQDRARPHAGRRPPSDSG